MAACASSGVLPTRAERGLSVVWWLIHRPLPARASPPPLNGVEVDALVRHAPTEPLHEGVLQPPAAPVHRHLEAGVPQDPGDAWAHELAAIDARQTIDPIRGADAARRPRRGRRPWRSTAARRAPSASDGTSGWCTRPGSAGRSRGSAAETARPCARVRQGRPLSSTALPESGLHLSVLTIREIEKGIAGVAGRDKAFVRHSRVGSTPCCGGLADRVLGIDVRIGRRWERLAAARGDAGADLPIAASALERSPTVPQSAPLCADKRIPARPLRIRLGVTLLLVAHAGSARRAGADRLVGQACKSIARSVAGLR